MRELKEIVSHELNSRPAADARLEYNPAPLEKKADLEIQGERRVQYAKPAEQKEKREAGDKIHDLKDQLSALTREQEQKAANNPQTSKEKPPTFMERLMKGLKKLKEWFARRRREKFTPASGQLPDKQAEWILVPVWQQKLKALPGYILREYKEGMAEKIITAIKYIFKYISKAFKAVFSKRKG